MNPLVAGLLVLLLCAPAVHAEGGKDDDWMKGRLFAPELILKHRVELKLSDAQRDALRRELVALQAKASEIDFEMMDRGLEVQTLLDRHPVDGKAVLTQVDSLLAAENHKKRLYLETLINIKNLLTPAQVQAARGLAAGEP